MVKLKRFVSNLESVDVLSFKFYSLFDSRTNSDLLDTVLNGEF